MTYIQIESDKHNYIKETFLKYVKQYLQIDEEKTNPYSLKRYHTERVAEYMQVIAETEGLNKKEADFASLLGWLHDIGRFEQWKKYKTFTDADSENHSEIGVRIINELGILDKFSSYESDLICICILNHNQPRVPENQSDIVSYYSRMLRDADKLDIWEITLEKNFLFKPQAEELSDSYNLSNQILETFKTHTIVTVDMVKEPLDVYLFRLSWIFDISFQYAFNQTDNMDIPRRILAKMPDFREKETIEKIAFAYLGSKSDMAINP